MPTFVCQLWPRYTLWNRDLRYQFDGGVLETDDVGAAFVRGHPLFGRLIREGAPPPPKRPLHPELAKALAQGFGICPKCGQEFESAATMSTHLRYMHGKGDEDDGDS